MVIHHHIIIQNIDDWQSFEWCWTCSHSIIFDRNLFQTQCYNSVVCCSNLLFVGMLQYGSSEWTGILMRDHLWWTDNRSNSVLKSVFVPTLLIIASVWAFLDATILQSTIQAVEVLTWLCFVGFCVEVLTWLCFVVVLHCQFDPNTSWVAW